MSDSVWRLAQQTRQVQSVRGDARGLWNDSAATHIDQRFLRPHHDSASRMVKELEAQLATAEKSADQVEQAKEFGVAANRQAAIAGEAIAESQRSQASTYEYAQQAWQHENDAAQLEALALSLAEQASGVCNGCASHRGDAGAAVHVAMQPAPTVAPGDRQALAQIGLVESRTANGGINFLPVSDEFGVLASTVPAAPNFQDVVIHGNPDVFGSHTGPPVSPEELAAMVAASSQDSGGPIRLVSCSSGNISNGAAQQFSNAIGRPTMAATDTVWAIGRPGGNNHLVVGPNYTVPTGQWRVFTPKGSS